MRDFKGMKRQRGRNRGTGGPGSGGGSGGGQGGGGKPSQNVNRAFDSNGPDGVKVRGHAQSVYEKYQQLARDAFSSGDRVLAENHLQHAEHYFRVLRLIQPQRPTAEIVARDVFASGFDIDFEDEGDEAGFEAAAEEIRTDERDAYGDRSRQDQSRQDQGRQDQSRQDQGRQDQGRGDQPRQDQSRGDQARGDQARGDRRDARFGDRQNGDRQNGDRQNGDRGERAGGGAYGGERSTADRSAGEPERNGDRQNGERQNGRGPRPNDRGERPRNESRRDERAGGYGESPREFGRDRPEGRTEARVEAGGGSRPSEVATDTARVEAFDGDAPTSETTRPDPMPLIEPQSRPFTPSLETTSPAPAFAPAEGSPMLRSVDGGVSEAPAFLQAFAPAPSGTESFDEPVVKRPRGRPRKRPIETEDNAAAPTAEPEEI